MLGCCDHASIYTVKNQRAEVYSLFPTWRRDGKQGRTRDTSIMTCPMSPSKRALLPQWEVALSRFSISVRATMQKIVYFFGESA